MGMIRFVAYIRPHRLEDVKSAIAALGVSGMTVGDARGTGNSPEKSLWLEGEANVIAMPIRSRLEVVAPRELMENLIEVTQEAARTGSAGDGKIFVFPVADAIRVRTEERGEDAI